MPIGPRDRLDQLLVDKYSGLTTHNFELDSQKTMTAERSMEIMNFYGYQQRVWVELKDVKNSVRNAQNAIGKVHKKIVGT